MRTHAGALSRFYLDALLGLSPIRTHGAETSVAREHESLLVEWARTGRALVATYVRADLVQAAIGTLLAAWLLFRYERGSGDPSGVLLLVYWSLSLPTLGQELGALLRQAPGHRNTALRLLEPLGAIEEDAPSSEPAPPATKGASIAFDAVSVVASGHAILEDVRLRIAPGEHVAIVGSSGAGKSSLLGVLLGLHRPSAGAVVVDGAPYDRSALLAMTAWVDPAVQIWNRALVDNLLYGAPPGAPSWLGRAIDASDLAGVLEKLPDGMQTALGEGGGLVSGGEGQRVRIARALLRHDARLALLDEPFRGLDREKRRELTANARAWWKDATLLCVTHDVSDTTSFPRVVVVEGGRVVEDGSPSELLATDSRYRAMVETEHAVAREVWDEATWKRFVLARGRLDEETRVEEKRA
jgi:ATP-binding cassette subfamily B protein